MRSRAWDKLLAWREDSREGHHLPLRAAVLLGGATLALALAGCGGSQPTANISVGDLPAIIAAPSQGGWSEYEDYAHDPHVVTYRWFRYYGSNPDLEALLARFKKAGFRRGYWKYWKGRAGGVAASDTLALLFRDDSGASRGLDALRKWTKKTPPDGTRSVTDVSADGLGDESWAIRFRSPSGFPSSETMAYGLRLGNLVAYFRMVCEDLKGCSPAGALDDAARAYAREILARAQAAG